MPHLVLTLRDLAGPRTLAEMQRQHLERRARLSGVPLPARAPVAPASLDSETRTGDVAADIGTAHVEAYYRHVIAFSGWTAPALAILADVTWNHRVPTEVILGPIDAAAALRPREQPVRSAQRSPTRPRWARAP